MRFARRLYDWVLGWAEHPAGTWALFGISFAESSFFPIPPDVLQIALSLGKPGEMDSASASYGTTFWDGTMWHMYYLGTPNSSPAPDRVPWFPYTTMKAKAPAATGPWTKQQDVTPFKPKHGTYYSDTASPGAIERQSTLGQRRLSRTR